MSDWLSSLPHQIPFRAASAVVERGEKTIQGRFLWTANDLMPSAIMLVEAMAQFAGGLVFHDRAGHGLLTGIERCEITRPIDAGDVVAITITLEGSFGGTHRFSGVGSIGGLECIRGRFYLSEPQPDEKT